MKKDVGRVVLFDGVCGLCTWSVRFIIRRDAHCDLRFASLQSEAGTLIAAAHGIDAGRMDTLVLVEGETAYVRSDAALRIARCLTLPWRLAGALTVVPRFFREPLYRLVARHRYRWFGKLDAGWIPPTGLEERFL